MPASRSQRPEALRDRLVLTERDLALLAAIDHHRYARTDHLKALFFRGTSLRCAQLRLQKLWRHRYLDRVHLAAVVDAERRPPRGAGTPIYTLGRLGEAALRGPSEATAPQRGLASPVNVQHHLVVTDFMVSLAVATSARPDLELAEAVHEWDLWRRLKACASSKAPKDAVVPDGAATISRGGAAPGETFYLEVVRAGVRAGNGALWDKMLRYSELNHQGAFRDLYGHERVRAVLIATTTHERAEHFRSLAKSLPHGRKLFAFGAYEDRDAEGRAKPRFVPGRLLDLDWTTVEGETLRLGEGSLRPRSPAI